MKELEVSPNHRPGNPSRDRHSHFLRWLEHTTRAHFGDGGRVNQCAEWQAALVLWLNSYKQILNGNNIPFIYSQFIDTALSLQLRRRFKQLVVSGRLPCRRGQHKVAALEAKELKSRISHVLFAAHQHNMILTYLTKTIYKQVWWSLRTTHVAALEPLNTADTGSYESTTLSKCQ